MHLVLKLSFEQCDPFLAWWLEIPKTVNNPMSIKDVKWSLDSAYLMVF